MTAARVVQACVYGGGKEVGALYDLAVGKWLGVRAKKGGRVQWGAQMASSSNMRCARVMGRTRRSAVCGRTCVGQPRAEPGPTRGAPTDVRFDQSSRVIKRR